jgi:hypothetical protein
MAWTDKFWKPIKLKNGHIVATLGDAREIISTLPALSQGAAHWQDAEELITRAATTPSAMDEALGALVRAMKVDDLI